MLNKKMYKKFDYILLIIILALMSIGVVGLMSATQGNMADVYKQLTWVVFSIVGMVIIATIDYEMLGSYSFRIYLSIMILLIAVLFTRPINGARSWFDFGPFSIQPGELAKIFLIITLAKHIDKIVSKDEKGINKPKNLILVFLHAGLPIVLIMIQPDFGTAVVIIAITLAMIFLGNISYKYVIPVVLVGIVSIFLLRYLILIHNMDLFFNHYQAERIRVFFDPQIDPRGSGYNVLQAQMAIGSGQLNGMGLFKGTQTQLGSIPAKTTDFIFAVIGEELGFVFGAIVVLLFVLLLIKCVSIAKMSKDFHGSLIAVGVTTMIGIHVLVNIGMNIGLVPVTGIPLPFISYGGSSFLTNMMGIGLVMSVAAKAKK